MNSNHDQQLESAIRRELKALPELTAPSAVASRVMAAIERQQQLAWYRRSWTTWPTGVQLASLTAMLMMFGGLCFAGWELSHGQTIAQAGHRLGQWFSGLNAITGMLGVLAESIVLVVKKLGTTFIIACLVAAGMGYALFLGLGTVYFRLAFGKR